jgi:hypothetical protein
VFATVRLEPENEGALAAEAAKITPFERANAAAKSRGRLKREHS